MLIQASIIEAGPRGNKCAECKTKVKAPDIVLKASGKFNRYTGYPSESKYCRKCGLQKVNEAFEKLKDFLSVLGDQKSEGSEAPSQVVTRRKVI